MSTHTTPDRADVDADEQSDQPTLETDLVFELLKNHRRRRVVEVLDAEGPVSLGDLAETLAAEENDTTVAALSADERKRVYIGLYQTHLPKMDDAGVVSYDRDEGTISPGPAMAQLVPYLDPADEAADAVSQPPRSRLDLSSLDDSVTLPAWALLGALLVVGLVAVAATAIPGPAWVAVLVLVAAGATWLVRWQ